MESQMCLDSGTQVDPAMCSFLDRDPGCTSSVPDHIEQDQPEKKATRQWAAWTHHEEESFFTALRQVGKNFEKITHRVQSKNKEQVRHYYYRVVKRMNKLLDPGLCLDAKNSKDTNAAMLRWWSLLEKYSCKASNLHRRPRRFKLFVEALESQLLKDRKKIRKRPTQGESCPTAQSTNTSQNKTSGPDTRVVNSKVDVSDSHNIERLSGKGSLKRPVNADHCNKGDSTTIKAARKRQKQGFLSPAAYRKWEKAAIAGVSLVADAAEHLERAAMDRCVESGRVMKDAVDPIQKVVPHLPITPQNHCMDSDAHSSVKIKLQLFPFDDGTRTTLESDKHNPFLELTLAARKKISSVLEHINRKWGNSNMASGELTLFPYACQEKQDSFRWTQKSTASAVDVYNLIGCPPVFRLRYGWFANPVSISERSQNHDDACNCLPKIMNEQHSVVPISTDIINDISEYADGYPEDCFVKADDHVAHISTNKKLLKEKDDGIASSAAMVWVDAMTSMSVGDLLSEVPSDGNSDFIKRPIAHSGQYHEFCSFNCDSFDVAIAAYMAKDKQDMNSPAVDCHSRPSTTTLWDAEETCDAFLFQSTHMEQRRHTSPATAASPPNGIVQELHHVLDDAPESSAAGVYWAESLRALDFDVISTKYHGEEMMLGDSLGALNNLLANSCDVFQNPLFCGGQGHDKVDSSLPGAREEKM